MSRPAGALRRPEYIGDPLRDLWTRGRVGAVARRLAVSPWFWLALGSLAIFAVVLTYTSWMATFWVMSDEMSYMKEAVHFWDRRGPVPPSDIFYASASQLPALLRAPTLLLGDIPAAWNGMMAVSVAAFASASVPAYLVAREIVTSRWVAVLAALSCVFVPWIAITGSLLTEGIAYPASVWAMAAMYLGLSRPGWKTDALALAGIALAAGARSQLIVLLPAYVGAIVLHTAGWALAHRPQAREIVRGAVRRHALLLAGGVLFGLFLVAGGLGHLNGLLGNYSVTTSGSLVPKNTLAVARELVGTISLAVGGVPAVLAFAFLVATLRRPDSRERHAFAALMACSSVLLLFVAASFIVRFTAGAGLSERYAAYIAPLLLIGTFGALSRSRPMPIALVAGAVFGWWCFTAIPDLAESKNAFAPAAPFHKLLNNHLGPIVDALPGHMKVAQLCGLVVIAVALTFAIPRRLSSPRLTGTITGAVLAAVIAAQTGYTLYAIGWNQRGADPTYLATRDWVDKTVGWNTKVAAVLGEAYDPVKSWQVWWEAQFWNKSVDQEYLPPDTDPVGQDRYKHIDVDPRTGVLHGLQGERYVLSSSSNQKFRLAGTRRVRNVGLLALDRIPPAPRAIWSLEKTDALGGFGLGTTATYRRFESGAPGVLHVSVTKPRRAALRHARLEVHAYGRSRSIDVPAAGAAVRLPRYAKTVTFRVHGRRGTRVKLDVVGPDA